MNVVWTPVSGQLKKQEFERHVIIVRILLVEIRHQLLVVFNRFIESFFLFKTQRSIRQSLLPLRVSAFQVI